MEFVGIYGKLGKLNTLHQEYAKARQADVHRFWFSYAGQAFAEWLPTFYEVVLQMLERVGVATRTRAPCFPKRAPSMYGRWASLWTTVEVERELKEHA